jgi:hypothetical protein
MQFGESSRTHEKRQEENRGRTGPKWTQVGRPSPFCRRFGAPFDLDDPWPIYSHPAKSHTSIHSPSTAEEQRREGHHSREEGVEMVD